MKNPREPYPNIPREFKRVLQINYVVIVLNVLGAIFVTFLDSDVLNAGGSIIFAVLIFYYNNKFNQLEFYAIGRLKILYIVMIVAYCSNWLLLDRPSAIIWLAVSMIQFYTLKNEEIVQYFIDYGKRISWREPLNIREKRL